MKLNPKKTERYNNSIPRKVDGHQPWKRASNCFQAWCWSNHLVRSPTFPSQMLATVMTNKSAFGYTTDFLAFDEEGASRQKPNKHIFSSNYGCSFQFLNWFFFKRSFESFFTKNAKGLQSPIIYDLSLDRGTRFSPLKQHYVRFFFYRR